MWGQLQYCVELQSCRAAGPHCLTHARDHALTACRRLCLRLRPPALPCPADANSIAQQALGNIRTVYAFNGTERTLAAYAASLDEPVRVSLPAVPAVPHAGPAMPPLWTLPARCASPSAPRLLCLLSRHPLPRCDYTAEPSLRHLQPPTVLCVAAPCLPLCLQVGIRQGFLGGLVVGITNCVAFFAYALTLWYGSTRVEAGAYTGGKHAAGQGQGGGRAQLTHLAG